MGRVQRRKGNVAKNKHLHKKKRTRNFSRDVDQIYEDVNVPGKKEQLLNQPINEDLPGLAQYYCLSCARYFVNEKALQNHLTTKVHKKNLKKLQEKPYSIKESEEYGK